MQLDSVFARLFSPAEEAAERLQNVTVMSRKSTEPSINDFQDFVTDMQKTITSLRKQVRVSICAVSQRFFCGCCGVLVT